MPSKQSTARKQIETLIQRCDALGA